MNINKIDYLLMYKEWKRGKDLKFLEKKFKNNFDVLLNFSLIFLEKGEDLPRVIIEKFLNYHNDYRIYLISHIMINYNKEISDEFVERLIKNKDYSLILLITNVKQNNKIDERLIYGIIDDFQSIYDFIIFLLNNFLEIPSIIYNRISLDSIQSFKVINLLLNYGYSSDDISEKLLNSVIKNKEYAYNLLLKFILHKNIVPLKIIKVLKNTEDIYRFMVDIFDAGLEVPQEILEYIKKKENLRRACIYMYESYGKEVPKILRE